MQVVAKVVELGGRGRVEGVDSARYTRGFES